MNTCCHSASSCSRENAPSHSGTPHLVRLPIGQALADHAQQRRVSASRVVNAERHAVVVAELELREVAVKVLLTAVLVDTLHAALEDAERSFNRVGVDRAAH